MLGSIIYPINLEHLSNLSRCYNNLTLIQIRKSSADYFSGAGLDRRAHRMANIKLDAGVGL